MSIQYIDNTSIVDEWVGKSDDVSESNNIHFSNASSGGIGDGIFASATKTKMKHHNKNVNSKVSVKQIYANNEIESDEDDDLVVSRTAMNNKTKTNKEKIHAQNKPIETKEGKINKKDANEQQVVCNANQNQRNDSTSNELATSGQISTNERIDVAGIKRKRTKTRSKQKNIRKDNRADDKKPEYLRFSTNHNAERPLTEKTLQILKDKMIKDQLIPPPHNEKKNKFDKANNKRKNKGRNERNEQKTEQNKKRKLKSDSADSDSLKPEENVNVGWAVDNGKTI